MQYRGRYLCCSVLLCTQVFWYSGIPGIWYSHLGSDSSTVYQSVSMYTKPVPPQIQSLPDVRSPPSIPLRSPGARRMGTLCCSSLSFFSRSSMVLSSLVLEVLWRAFCPHRRKHYLPMDLQHISSPRGRICEQATETGEDAHR